MNPDSSDPVAALREVAFWLERARAETRRVKAYRNAADVLAALTPERRAEIARRGDWTSLRGIGPKTAAVAAAAAAGDVPDYLAELRADAEPIGPHAGGEFSAAAIELAAAVRGDLHTHSNWSDGGSPPAEMAATARGLGREYWALTDHSPRLTVANGLSADRLRDQLELLANLARAVEADGGSEFRILTGIEVDILDDGSLDQDRELLAELDVVVASVHSHLRADSATMTARMIAAVTDPDVDVLGHCTGRLVEGGRGTRPESTFDARAVFEACRDAGTAVEINSRPERQDPPERLMELALEIGCLFAIDTDAHAPGQLDWLGLGCARAAAVGIPPERIVTTWPVDRLLAWTADRP
ncbi:PHP domain-containing protein [Rhodococcus kroppenstedtii]|uniref:PHP domain-containing protein n=1 Tax=Rhodococcoides kroppenstedtii TaxID=293050 RepID=UPI00295533F0|nr:PHP domain-containing protein [Rhodococcus kroppenstedtii]MDV7196354.1 PHP domain-containing protein [Rhodococcus kroppenstedtii]